MLVVFIQHSTDPGGVTVDHNYDYVVTGTANGYSLINIREGTAVTFRDLTINNTSVMVPVNCEGNATIILEGTNTLKSGKSEYPGIDIGPANTTLTIRGTGSLSINHTGMDYTPAIGSSPRSAHGNIVIEGGTFDLIGGTYAAAIGAGKYPLGDITVTSGVTHLTATAGTYAPCSIGKGYTGTCGTVTIGGVTYENGVTTSPFTYPSGNK